MNTFLKTTKQLDPKITQALLDILEHANEASQIVEIGEEQYFDNWIYQRAAEMVLVRAGESAKRIDTLDSSFIITHPELDLRGLIDARNFTAHNYDRVESAVIWDILTDDLPVTAQGIRDLLNLHPTSPWAMR